MKISFNIEIEFESWFEDEREPKNENEWINFFQEHLFEDSSVIGIDNGEYQDMVLLKSIILTKI
jgi:hypothetical protein